MLECSSASSRVEKKLRGEADCEEEGEIEFLSDGSHVGHIGIKLEHLKEHGQVLQSSTEDIYLQGAALEWKLLYTQDGPTRPEIHTRITHRLGQTRSQRNSDIQCW